MAPSIHEEPLDRERTPRASRIRLYDDVGLAVHRALVVHHVLTGVVDGDLWRHIASGAVRQLVHDGYEFLLNDKLVDLSRYEETDDPRHTWLR